MNDDEETQIPPEMLDALLKRQEEALGLLVPTDHNAPFRKPYVTHIKGPQPKLIDLLRLRYWVQEASQFMIGNGSNVDPVDWLIVHSASVNGERAKQIVESVRISNIASRIAPRFRDMIRRE